ncbi:hypothetical protein ACFWP5_50435 [Streptomyces sp. NPDC058469]|uniref:hypothetical protein n=1 Tax=Streptomyces sp. NPDC058469 TaxID=3346514 RepID=UPI00365373BD
MAQGAVQVRQMWPNILEVVKNRRRFTWILLSQNAQVTGFDGTTLQIGFVNAGARDNFNSSGSEDVLKQALSEQFNVQWKIDAVVDPSGGGTPPPQPGGSYGGGGGGAAGGYGGASGGYGAPGPATPASGPASPQAAPTSAPAPTNTTNSPSAQAPAQSHQPPAAPSPAPARRTVSAEDDTAEDDDPDLDESALSGHELIVRELGATVMEEFTNE